MVAMVLDASVALGAVLPDEASARARTVLARVIEFGALVPATWHIEVGAVLLRTERRGLVGASWRRDTLVDLGRLPIETDLETPARAWADSMILAHRHRLSLYDAAYLELSLRKGMPLATLDRVLHRAAEQAGAELV